jgi:hypothetical protein
MPIFHESSGTAYDCSVEVLGAGGCASSKSLKSSSSMIIFLNELIADIIERVIP